MLAVVRNLRVKCPDSLVVRNCVHSVSVKIPDLNLMAGMFIQIGIAASGTDLSQVVSNVGKSYYFRTDFFCVFYARILSKSILFMNSVVITMR